MVFFQLNVTGLLFQSFRTASPTLFTIDTTLTTYMPTYVAPLMPKTAGTYIGGVMALISFSLIFILRYVLAQKSDEVRRGRLSENV